MAVSSIAIGNAHGYTTTDLSISKRSQTARMPVPATDVFQAQDGEFYMRIGDRPYFWFNGQWNPMATLYDIPPAPYYAYSVACAFDRSTLTPYTEVIMNDSVSYKLLHNGHIDYDSGAGTFGIQQSGMYLCGFQLTIDKYSQYFGIKNNLYAYLTRNGASTYLFNTGWNGGDAQYDYLSTGTSALVYLDAGDKVDFRIYFSPDSNNGDLVIVGVDPYNPSELGMFTYSWITYSSPLLDSTSNEARLHEVAKEFISERESRQQQHVPADVDSVDTFSTGIAGEYKECATVTTDSWEMA